VVMITLGVRGGRKNQKGRLKDRRLKYHWGERPTCSVWGKNEEPDAKGEEGERGSVGN